MPQFLDDAAVCCLACVKIYAGEAGKFNAKTLRAYRRRLAAEEEDKTSMGDVSLLSPSAAAAVESGSEVMGLD